MILVTANTRRATVSDKETLTVGSVGIQVQFDFSTDWAGLTKVACFKAGDDGETYHVAIGANQVVVIPGGLFSSANEGEPLFAGVYGEDNGVVVIPTLWASLGAIRPSVSDDAEEEETPEEYWRDSVVEIATNAESVAYEALDYASDAKATADNAADAVDALYDSISGSVSAAAASAADAASAASSAAESAVSSVSSMLEGYVTSAQNAAEDAASDVRDDLSDYVSDAEAARDRAETAAGDAEAAATRAQGLVPDDAAWIDFGIEETAGEHYGWLYVITGSGFSGADFSVNNDNGAYQGWLEVTYS